MWYRFSILDLHVFFENYFVELTRRVFIWALWRAGPSSRADFHRVFTWEKSALATGSRQSSRHPFASIALYGFRATHYFYYGVQDHSLQPTKFWNKNQSNLNIRLLIGNVLASGSRLGGPVYLIGFFWARYGKILSRDFNIGRDRRSS
jgi:hypothetical protein